MADILFSVIINNYNYDRYLREAIDSALNQTYPGREVIVIDDGSTDDSREIIQAYGPQISAVLKENGGQASAFNVGWDVCRGDLILFLDSDDMLLPAVLETVAREYNAHRHLGIAKLQYTLQAVSSSGKALGYDVPPEHPRPGSALELILTTCQYPSPPTSGNVFTRAFLEAVMPVPEEFWLGADSYLVTKAPFLGQVIAIEECLGQYRVHGDNYWSGYIQLDRLMNHLEIYQKSNELLVSTAQSYGFTMAPPTEDWKQMKVIMMRYKLGMPIPAEFQHRGFYIAAAGIRAIARDRYLNIMKKFVYSLWFALVALIPRSCKGLMQWLFIHFYSWYDLRSKVHAISLKVKKRKG